MNDKWEFYQESNGDWRWRRTAPNGNIVGASTEGETTAQQNPSSFPSKS